MRRDYATKETELARAVRHLTATTLQRGWGTDPAGGMVTDILYVELPTGQASFHVGRRGVGPDHDGQWDGVTGASGDRVEAAIKLLVAGDAS